RRVDAVHGLLRLRLGALTLVVAADAVARVREPDAAVGVRRNVVRRVQALAVVALRDGSDATVVLVARDAPAAVLARQLPAREVERVAVRVAGRLAKRR